MSRNFRTFSKQDRKASHNRPHLYDNRLAVRASNRLYKRNPSQQQVLWVRAGRLLDRYIKGEVNIRFIPHRPIKSLANIHYRLPR